MAVWRGGGGGGARGVLLMHLEDNLCDEELYRSVLHNAGANTSDETACGGMIICAGDREAVQNSARTNPC